MLHFQRHLLSLAAATLPLLSTACLMRQNPLTYDNPQIRKLQAAHSAEVVPSKSRRQALARTCAQKVHCITSGPPNKAVTTGRAAAISADGYFLTAYHVVKHIRFHLSGVQLTAAEQRQLQQTGSLDIDPQALWHVPGRIVWFNEGADLAILKFPVASPDHFRGFTFPAEVGSVVHSADDMGHLLQPADRDDPEHAIGNGPFFSAGKVLFSQLFTHGPGVHTIGSTLIARGGMSGSPLVTENGQLCGILSQAGYSYLPKNDSLEMIPRSTARMLPPNLIREILRNDRNSH